MKKAFPILLAAVFTTFCTADSAYAGADERPAPQKPQAPRAPKTEEPKYAARVPDKEGWIRNPYCTAHGQDDCSPQSPDTTPASISRTVSSQRHSMYANGFRNTTEPCCGTAAIRERNMRMQQQGDYVSPFGLASKREGGPGWPSFSVPVINMGIQRSAGYECSLCKRAEALVAKYALKDYTGAILDYDKAIELDPTDPYLLYYRWVMHTKLAEADKVALVLSSITDAVAKVAQSKGWKWKIGEYIAGTVSEADLLAAAASQDPKEQHCEAFYFIGVKALANGDKTEAANNFQKSIQTHRRDVVEYKMAKLELEELGEK